MKEIELTQGKVALVDDGIFEELSKYKWYARWDGWHWYAMRKGAKQHTLSMARVVMGAKPGEMVDHRDNEATLDNRRSNLRICTGAQNQANRTKQDGCSSKYKGVCWNRGKWQVRIWVHGRCISLGRFAKSKEDDAGRAYNVAALLHFGEFARLNIIV